MATDPWQGRGGVVVVLFWLMLGGLCVALHYMELYLGWGTSSWATRSALWYSSGRTTTQRLRFSRRRVESRSAPGSQAVLTRYEVAKDESRCDAIDALSFGRNKTPPILKQMFGLPRVTSRFSLSQRGNILSCSVGGRDGHYHRSALFPSRGR